MKLDERLREEAEFADLHYAQHSKELAGYSKRMFSKYTNPVHMWDVRQRAATLLGDLSGKSLLDYGCGMGEEAVYFALLGAKVTAIDISEVGVEMTRERARLNGLSDRVSALVVDATRTGFESETFEIAHGLGILHHVGLKPGLEEIHRLLRPGGRAVFLEPMGNSRTIESCKRGIHRLLGRRLKLTPVTSGEENLKLHELRTESRRFRVARFYTYHITHRVRKLIIPPRLYESSLILDYHLLRILPFLRHFAGAVVIYLEK